MNSRTPSTVVLADDHPVVLRGLADLVGGHGDFAVVGEFPDGEAVLAAIRRDRPNLAIIDVHMAGLSGMDVLSAIKREQLTTIVVLLTASFDERRLLEALALGAEGILLKEAAPETLLECLVEVAAGRRWLAPRIIEASLERSANSRKRGSVAPATLTAREAELVRLVAEGLSNKDIARRLAVAEGTVKAHLHNVYTKLDVTNRTSLAALIFGRANRSG